VDDVKEQGEIAFSILSRLGYSVTAISSGEETVEYMRSMPPGSAQYVTALKFADIVADHFASCWDLTTTSRQMHTQQSHSHSGNFSQELTAGVPYTPQELLLVDGY
jgi:CheY-like chemotaxis protein